MSIINIGVSKEAIKSARQAILDIIKVSPDREVSVAALDAFTKVTQVGHTAITNCNFTTKSSKR